MQQGCHYTYREGKIAERDVVNSYTSPVRSLWECVSTVSCTRPPPSLYGCISFARKNMDRTHTQNGSTQMYARWGLPAHPFASSGPRRRPQTIARRTRGASLSRWARRH